MSKPWDQARAAQHRTLPKRCWMHGPVGNYVEVYAADAAGLVDYHPAVRDFVACDCGYHLCSCDDGAPAPQPVIAVGKATHIRRADFEHRSIDGAPLYPKHSREDDERAQRHATFRLRAPVTTKYVCPACFRVEQHAPHCSRPDLHA